MQRTSSSTPHGAAKASVSSSFNRSRVLAEAVSAPIEALERRAYLAAQITDVLSDVPFSASELNQLGVEEVTFNGKTRYAYDGEFIVKLSGVSGSANKQVKHLRNLTGNHASAKSFARQYGRQIEIVQWLGDDGLVLVKAPSGASVGAVSKALKRMPGFRYLEPNSLVWAADRIPNDPNYGSLYGMSKIQMPKVWDITTGGLSSDLVVGVIDTGIDYTHPDLAANMWKNPGEVPGDGVDNDANGYVDDYYGYNFAGVRNGNPYDDNRHGTHVAGTIAAAGNNGIGVAGVNWNAKLMAIKFLNSGGSGSLADAAAAINYQASMLERGVKVLVSNNSWGGGGFDQSVKDAIDRYGTAGGLFVAAAGNDGVSSVFYPAGYTSNNIISVAASDENDNRAYFSNYGTSWVDLAAPGNNILSTVPGGSYTTLNGTSMASPHVAGAAALLWDIAGTDTPRQVIQNAILDGVTPLSQWSSLVDRGGRLNVWNSINLLDLSWGVTGATPADGALVTEPLTEFTLNFSADVAPASVDGTELLVNGTPSAFADVNGRTVTFYYFSSPLTTSGAQTIELPENAVIRTLDNRGVDAFSSSFQYDAIQLAVDATTPGDGQTVLAPLTSIDLTFNENINPASLATTDLVLNVGQVAGFEVLDTNQVRFNLSGLDDESVGTVTATLLADAVEDEFGFTNTLWISSFQLDNGTIQFGELGSTGPRSNLARSIPAQNGLISPAGEADEFQIDLDAGQQLTVVIDQVSTLHPAIEVLDADQDVLAYAAPDDIGQDAILQAFEVPATGTYTIRVFGEQSTTGAYRFQGLVNALVEEEGRDLPDNSTRADAQDLDPAMMSLASGAGRAVVVGVADAGSTGGRSELYAEEFDDAPGAEWTTWSSLANGRVAVGSSYGGFISPSALYMDRLPGGPFNYNEAVLTVDLSGAGNPVLTFAHADLGDEEHTLPNTYTGRANGDGVSISADGVTWHKIWGPTSAPRGQWQEVTVDLAAAAQSAGISLGSNFQIRFQQYDNLSLPSDGRGYDAVRITADAPSTDWYRFTGEAGRNVTVALNHPAEFALTVDLLDSNGTVLSSGVDSGDAARLLIENFTLADAGTYYVRIGGATGANQNYSLLVSQGLNLDVEPNDNIASAQDLGAGGRALGFVSNADADHYRINVNAGDAISVSTTTPGDDVGLIVNTLDPRVEIYGPDGQLAGGSPNGAADGRNVSMTYNAPVAGLYTIKILPESGEGNYVLSVSGNTGGPVPFSVVAVDPADEGLPTYEVSQITVDFSHTVLAASLDAADLTVNGAPAQSVELIDKNTAVFTLAGPVSTGDYTVALAEGAVDAVSGQPVQAFSSTFRVDVTPPTVIASSVQQDDFLAVGDLTLTVQFSELIRSANLDNSDFELVGANSGVSHVPASFGYDDASSTLTLDYVQLPEDRYTLTIKSGDGAIEDVAGLDLSPGDYVVGFDLETDVEQLPPLARRSPAGGLIFSSSKASKIDFAGDTDTFTVSLDAGQTATLSVTPEAGLTPVVQLLDESGQIVASNQAGTASQRALIEVAAIDAAGEYRVVISSVAGSTGSYTLNAALNSIAEVESQLGTPNDSFATAENLDGSSVTVSGPVARLGALGTLAAGTDDYYAFTMPADGVVTMVLSGVNVTDLELEVYNASEQLLTSGNPFTGEVGRAIQNLSANAGTYFIRVSGVNVTSDYDYALVVSQNANFNVEPNQNVATAQDMGSRGAVLGYQDGLEGDDFYKIAVNQNDPLDISTITPLDGTQLPGNTLDVAIELYDEAGQLVAQSTGGASDGRNVSLQHVAESTGVYIVRVIHQAGGGEYLLTATGQGGGFLPLTVTEVTPADQAILRVVPGEVTIRFSHALLAASVDAGDLLVDGVASAASAQLVEADTVVFTVPGLTEATHQIQVPAGSVQNLDATSNSAFASSFRIDLTPPAVADSSISDGAFLGVGDLTYDIRFSEAINPDLLSADDFILHGDDNGTDYFVDAYDYDTFSHTLTLDFINLPAQAYTMTIRSGDDAIEDLAGIDFDGDANATEGGDFTVNFTLETQMTILPSLTPVEPAAAGIQQVIQDGRIDYSGDLDEYLIVIPAGRLFSLVVTGSDGLQPSVNVTTYGGTPVASATAAGPDQPALIDGARFIPGGTLRIGVTGAGGTTGRFGVRLLTGANAEGEDNGGATNDLPAAAQDLGALTEDIGNGVLRGAVVGKLGTASADRFAVYADGFESPTFSPLWNFQTNAINGRIIRNLIDKGEGSASMSMDTYPTNGRFTLSEAIWTVNISGLNQPHLEFMHADLGDEEHAIPASWTGSVNGDGVSVSPDGGTTWYAAWVPTNLPARVWRSFDVDLVALAQQHNFQLGDNFKVKFQQYDDLSLPSDGRGWDNVRITAAGTSDHYRVSATAGQTLSVGVKATGSALVDLKIFDLAGNILASGVSGNQLSSVIDSFVAPTSGEYIIRIAASLSQSEEYSLLVQKNATLSSGGIA